MRTKRVLVGFLLAAALWVGCSGDGGTDPPIGCFLDEGSFRDLEVTAATSPIFFWCGARALTLLVRTVPGGQEVWRVQCPTGSTTRCILPPVTYGTVPPNTQETIPDTPLQAGRSFEFCISLDATVESRVCQEFQT